MKYGIILMFGIVLFGLLGAISFYYSCLIKRWYTYFFKAPVETSKKKKWMFFRQVIINLMKTFTNTYLYVLHLTFQNSVYNQNRTPVNFRGSEIFKILVRFKLFYSLLPNEDTLLWTLKISYHLSKRYRMMESVWWYEHAKSLQIHG